MSSSAKERREQRLARARDDYDNKDKDTGSDFGKRPGFFASASALEKLGVSEYRTSAGENGAAKTHRIHILPPHPDDPDQIGLKIYAHYDIGANESAHLCPKWMKRYLTKIGMDVPEEIADGRCPVCERHDIVLARYKKTKDNVSEKERKAMWKELRNLVPYSSSYKSPKPKKVLVWVVDGIDEDTMDEGVKYYMMPATWVYEDGVLEVCMDDDGSMIDILDTSKAGHSFQFRRKGEELSTKYTSPKLVARKWDVETETDWLDEVPRYTDVLKFSSYDTIAAALGKSVAAAAPPEEEEDAPRRRRRSAEDEEGEDAPPKRRRKAAEEDGGDDEPPRRRRRSEPEEDEDDDGSDADAIRNKIKDRRERIAAAKEEGDDKDEDAPPKRRRKTEPEEDEDEPPKRRRRPADVDEDDPDIPF